MSFRNGTRPVRPSPAAASTDTSAHPRRSARRLQQRVRASQGPPAELPGALKLRGGPSPRCPDTAAAARRPVLAAPGRRNPSAIASRHRSCGSGCPRRRRRGAGAEPGSLPGSPACAPPADAPVQQLRDVRLGGLGRCLRGRSLAYGMRSPPQFLPGTHPPQLPRTLCALLLSLALRCPLRLDHSCVVMEPDSMRGTL